MELIHHGADGQAVPANRSSLEAAGASLCDQHPPFLGKDRWRNPQESYLYSCLEGTILSGSSLLSFHMTLALLMTGRDVLQAHQWNPLLLPWRQRRMEWDRGTWDALGSRNLCFSIDLPQQRFKWFFPDIYYVSTCHHDFAQAKPFFQSVPPSYLQLTRSYSNIASSWRSSYLCLHSCPVVFNNLFWASYITALTTSCWCSRDTWYYLFSSSPFLPLLPALQSPQRTTPITLMSTLSVEKDWWSHMLIESAQRISCLVV